MKHLRDAFGEKRLASITPSMIRDWYEGDHPEGPWAFKRECERLKAILTDASNPASTGIRQSSKRIRSSCQYRQIRKRNRAKSAHWTRTRYIACTRKCPNTRASACCWQRWLGHEDRGIVCPASRGHRLEKQNAQRQRQREPRNRGPGRITNRQNQKRHSVRTCPIPDLLIPVLQKHLDTLDTDNPMLIQAKRGEVIAQTTLAGQFKTARERLNSTNRSRSAHCESRTRRSC